MHAIDFKQPKAIYFTINFIYQTKVINLINFINEIQHKQQLNNSIIKKIIEKKIKKKILLTSLSLIKVTGCSILVSVKFKFA